MELTPEQLARIPEWSQKWFAISTRTGEADWPRAEAAVRELYAVSKADAPPILRVKSPLAGSLLATLAMALWYLKENGVPESPPNTVELLKKPRYTRFWPDLVSSFDELMRRVFQPLCEPDQYSNLYAMGARILYAWLGSCIDSCVDDRDRIAAVKAAGKMTYFPWSWHPWYGGQLWPVFVVRSSFLIEVCGWALPETHVENGRTIYPRRAEKAYRDLAESACFVWPNTHFAMICARPTAIQWDASYRPSNLNGPAISFPDGWGYYAYEGIEIPRWLAETPDHALDPGRIREITNAEVRRVFIHKVGLPRIVQALKPKVLDSATYTNRSGSFSYELVGCRVDGDEPDWKFLKFENASIPGILHIEDVPPGTKTVREALLFRNKLTEEQVDDEFGAEWKQHGDVIVRPKGKRKFKLFPSELT